MKSKAFWGLFSVLAASVPAAPALAQPLDPYILVDYHEQSLAQEKIYGTVYDGPRLRVVTDPSATTSPIGISAALRRSFEFPIEMSVERDSSITTGTPITDRYRIHEFGDCNGDNRLTAEDLAIHQGICNSRFAAWAEEVTECLKSGPVLIRDLTGNEIYVNGEEGEIVLNSSGKAVCRQFLNAATPVSMERQCTDVTVESRPFIAPSTPQQDFAPIRGLW
jgi:hypothetical protein